MWFLRHSFPLVSFLHLLYSSLLLCGCPQFYVIGTCQSHITLRARETSIYNQLETVDKAELSVLMKCNTPVGMQCSHNNIIRCDTIMLECISTEISNPSHPATIIKSKVVCPTTNMDVNVFKPAIFLLCPHLTQRPSLRLCGHFYVCFQRNYFLGLHSSIFC